MLKKPYPANQYTCEICGQTLACARSLGGHKSKMHPGASENYKRKMAIREKNVDDRHYRANAKELLQRRTAVDLTKCRADISIVKKLLRCIGTSDDLLDREVCQAKIEKIVQKLDRKALLKRF
jgi:hypothetical protein